jgi:hypothetical protein
VLHKVDGIYARGKGRTNQIEAQAVVQAAKKLLSDPTRNELSLGIVTMNSEQQRLIEDLLDSERRKRPDLERFFNHNAREPVFIKNLETVQGDQRDVIMISVCYGPTEPGAATMSMSFGPLNRKGGERRLPAAEAMGDTHKTPEVKAWLEKHPHFKLRFTPTSASWLNLVERFFAEITTKPIRRGSYTSVGDLETAIYDYPGQHNTKPKPFTWTKTAEDILTRERRALDKLDEIRGNR